MSLEILQTLWRWIDRVVDSKEGLARRCIRRRWLNVFVFYLTQETIRKRPDLPVEVYQLIAAAAIAIATKMTMTMITSRSKMFGSIYQGCSPREPS